MVQRRGSRSPRPCTTAPSVREGRPVAEKIFGPTKDSGVLTAASTSGCAYKGIICERLRGRGHVGPRSGASGLGHIELAAPWFHIWYLGTRSWLAETLPPFMGHRGLGGAEGQAAGEGHLLRRQPGQPGIDEEKRQPGLANLGAERGRKVATSSARRDLELSPVSRRSRRSWLSSRPRGPARPRSRPAAAAEKELTALRERSRTRPAGPAGPRRVPEPPRPQDHRGRAPVA